MSDVFVCGYCGRRGDCLTTYEGICGDTADTLPEESQEKKEE